MPEEEEERYKPPKLKMKLKETAAEKEEKAWRKERKRLRKESKQIYAANGISPTTGLAVTPPHTGRNESMSPPRKRRREDDTDGDRDSKPSAMDDWDESIWQAESSAYYRHREQASRNKADEEYRQKLFDLMEDDEGPNAFVSGRYHEPEPAAQALHRRWQSGQGSNDVPADEMNDEEYAESIRYGMWKRKNKDEAERLERLERWKKDETARKAKEKTMKEEEERKRIDVIKAETGKLEQIKLAKQLQDYRAKWETLRTAATTSPGTPDGSSTTSPTAVTLRFVELPWPTFTSDIVLTLSADGLTTEGVRRFLTAVARSNMEISIGEKDDTMRKVLREAILAYHPDRYIGRYMGLVRADEQEMVKDAVVRCSQIINQLAAELKE